MFSRRLILSAALDVENFVSVSFDCLEFGSRMNNRDVRIINGKIRLVGRKGLNAVSEFHRLRPLSTVRPNAEFKGSAT